MKNTHNWMLERWTRAQLARNPRFAARWSALQLTLAAMPRAARRWLRRRLARKLALTLTTAALLLALTNFPVYADSITVDPGAQGINPGDGCSLVEAITNSNDAAQTFTDCAAGSGNDTITLPGSATLTYTTPFGTDAALPDVIKTLTIEGNDSIIQRDSGSASYFRIFNVYSPGDLTLNHVTLSGGELDNFNRGGGILVNNATLTLNDSTVSGNDAPFGGGIENYYGSVTLNRSTVTDNNQSCPCASFGGGIVNTDGSTLKLYSSTVSNNFGGYVGGGIINDGDVTIRNSTISGNSAFVGGGIANIIGTVNISQSIISGNAALFGGGIENTYGSVTLNQSTVSGNYAYAYGGGVLAGYYVEHPRSPRVMSGTPRWHENAALAEKFAVSSERAEKISKAFPFKSNPASFRTRVRDAIRKTMPKRSESVESVAAACPPTCPTTTTLVNSTLNGNTASYGAGFVNTYYSTAFLYNVTITNNTASIFAGGLANVGYATMNLHRTLISGNSGDPVASAPYSPANEIYDCSCSPIVSDDFNLFGHSGETNADAFDGFTPGASDIVATLDGTLPTALSDILDTTLANNGGPTQTNALVSGSPAIDQAPQLDCEPPSPTNGVDQRGAARNFGGACDVGAYEFGSPTAMDVTKPRAKIGRAGNIVIKWNTLTESRIAGFNVYRKTRNGKWKSLTAQFLPAKHAGDVASARYNYRDSRPQKGQVYRYKIQVLYLDGKKAWTDIVQLKVP